MDITVITPFYKGNAYMETLFGCVRRNAQAVPGKAVELILVNDSPDQPIQYEESWVSGFSVRIVTNSQNSGIHRSRVNGLREAAGTYIQFLDQDDLLSDNAFASQLPLMENADVVIANGFDQNPKSYGPIYKSLVHQQQAAKPRFYYTVGNQIVSPGHCLIRKDAIPAGWYDTCIRRNGADDLLLWLMMFAENARFVINPAQLYTHVDTGENVSANTEKMHKSSLEVLQVLKTENRISPRQARRYLRSCAMSRRYIGRSKARKILVMLCYPDVALERVALQLMKKF